MVKRLAHPWGLAEGSGVVDERMGLVVQEAHSWKLVEGCLEVENMLVNHLMGTPESKGVVAQFLSGLGVCVD